MARINVDDSLWSDSRFLRLCAELGNGFMAAGVVLIGWKTAQKYWCPNKSPIPEDKFFEAGLPEALVTVGLATRSKEGIRMRGSEEHFAWWFERRNAGLKSADSRRAKTGSAQPRRPEVPFEYSRRPAEQNSTGVEPLNINIPLSLNINKSTKEELKPSGEVENRPSPGTEANKRAWSAYREAFLVKYKVEPTRNGKVNAAIAQFVKRVGSECAPDILRFFLKHTDGLYLKTSHSVALAVRDAESLRTQWLRNRTVTTAEVRNLEKSQVFHSQLQRIESGEL